MRLHVDIFDGDGKDISDDVQLRDGKSNPWGWFQYRMEHKAKTIGFIECGGVYLDKPYTYKEKRGR